MTREGSICSLQLLLGLPKLHTTDSWLCLSTELLGLKSRERAEDNARGSFSQAFIVSALGGTSHHTMLKKKQIHSPRRDSGVQNVHQFDISIRTAFVTRSFMLIKVLLLLLLDTAC